ERRHHVVLVLRAGAKVENERRLAVKCQRCSSKQRAFETMRRAVAKHAPGRMIGLAVQLEIDRQRVEVVLDLPRRRKPAQHGALGGREDGLDAILHVSAHEASGRWSGRSVLATTLENTVCRCQGASLRYPHSTRSPPHGPRTGRAPMTRMIATLA